MLRNTKADQQRWEERPAAPRVPLTPSVFPDDAMAVIYKPARSAMTSGKARTREWKLRFEPRSPRYIEPLMGWTGNDDTLAQVELAFSSEEAAVAYARRQRLHYVLHNDKVVDGIGRQIGATNSTVVCKPQSTGRPWRLEWIERTLGPGGVISNGPQLRGEPSARCASPQDVLHDPALFESAKLDVLQRWALDGYLTELAISRGEAVQPPSRLDEVVDALMISMSASFAASQVARRNRLPTRPRWPHENDHDDVAATACLLREERRLKRRCSSCGNFRTEPPDEDVRTEKCEQGSEEDGGSKHGKTKQ